MPAGLHYSLGHGLPKYDVIHSHPLDLTGLRPAVRVMTAKKGLGLPSLLATGGYHRSHVINHRNWSPGDNIRSLRDPARFVRNGPHSVSYILFTRLLNKATLAEWFLTRYIASWWKRSGYARLVSMLEQSVLTNLHKLLATSVVEPHGVVHGTTCGDGYSSIYACQLLPSPIKRAPACTSHCTPFFTDSSYTAGVLALLFAFILGVTEGETAYDQKCTWCGCEFTARLRKSGNFLAYVKRAI